MCGARGRRVAARGSAQAPHKLRGQQAYARTRMNGLSNVKARSTAVRGAAPQQVQRERTEGGEDAVWSCGCPGELPVCAGDCANRIGSIECASGSSVVVQLRSSFARDVRALPSSCCVHNNTYIYPTLTLIVRRLHPVVTPKNDSADSFVGFHARCKSQPFYQHRNDYCTFHSKHQHSDGCVSTPPNSTYTAGHTAFAASPQGSEPSGVSGTHRQLLALAPFVQRRHQHGRYQMQPPRMDAAPRSPPCC